MHILSAYNRPFSVHLPGTRLAPLWVIEIPSATPSTMDERRPYFAYGSNLNAADLKTWSSSNGANFSSMEPICTAWLLDHSMAFHYFSRNRGGGAADVVQNGRGTAVPGVLFSLSDEGWSWMDKKEGSPRYYQRQVVFVITAAGDVVEAITYTVSPDMRRAEFVPPTAAYAQIVETGLTDYELPIEHLKFAIQNKCHESWISHVFVYGTLMSHHQRWAQLKPWSSGALQDGSVTGRLYDLGAYPGLRLDEQGLVHGELHRCDDLAGALAELDVIEGHNAFDPSEGLYIRTPVLVRTASGSVWAWTYIINAIPDHASVVPDGRWTS